MWNTQKEKLKESVTRYRFLENGKPVSFRKWIRLLQESPAFIEFFIEVLKASPYEGYFWEVKLVDQFRLEQDFEFVLVKSATLPGVLADDSYFKQYFKKGEQVVCFPNIGGDAQLIVPTAIGAASCYGHMAAFVKKAPEKQVMEFWKRVGQEYEKHIGENTKWLSTSGLGVYWLHVRIDSRPKYYQYEAYKN